MSYSPKAFEIAVLGTSQIGKFISTHGTTGDVIIPDSDKFSFGTGSDASIYFDATNLVIADENIPVKIGHASNTVTIAGNLTVDGTTTSVNQTYIDVTNAFVFEGATPNAYETTLGIVDPTADATINLPAMAAATYYLPVLAAASTTAITATPEELNYLDITTLGTAAASKAMTWSGTSTWTAAGGTCADLGIVTTVDINGGAIDGSIIGAAVPAAGTFTTLDCTDGAFAVANVDIDGATDIGAAIVDADLFIVDDGGAGTNRKCAASRLKTYISGSTVDSVFADLDTVGSDINLVDVSVTGSITVKVPENSTAGTQYIIKKTDSSTNTVTVSRTTADTIDGSASKILYHQYETITVVSDGSNWHIV